MDSATDLSPLIDWFERHARNLPWRNNRSAWSVLVSEIMLQQTQVSTVIPYYKRWMERFPTPSDLAQAPLDEVLKMWEGLGYYRRARALHSAAKILAATPPVALSQAQEEETSIERWLQLPGIGPYTAAAIVAFAFQQRSAPVDGNVLRVMTRLLGLPIDIAKASSHKLIREKLLQMLPLHKPWVVAEGLIELGAMVCKKEPLCLQCPLKSSCLAHRDGLESQLPVKSKAESSHILHHSVAVIRSRQERLLVQYRHAKGLFHGLWRFPYFECDESLTSEYAFQMLQFEESLQLKLQFSHTLQKRQHTFTKYKAHLFPLVFTTAEEMAVASDETWHYQWVDSKQLEGLTFCSGYRDIRQEILN